MYPRTRQQSATNGIRFLSRVGRKGLLYRIPGSIIMLYYYIRNVRHCLQSNDTLDNKIGRIGLRFSIYCRATKSQLRTSQGYVEDLRIWRSNCRLNEIFGPFAQQRVLQILGELGLLSWKIPLTCWDIKVPSPDILAWANTIINMLLVSRRTTQIRFIEIKCLKHIRSTCCWWSRLSASHRG